MPRHRPSVESSLQDLTASLTELETRAAGEAPADDDDAVQAERRRYALEGARTVIPDQWLGRLLGGGEVVRMVEAGVRLIGRPGDRAERGLAPVTGTLVVTSKRVLHVGDTVMSLDLDRIDDAAVAPRRLLLLLRAGHSLVVEAARPRLLRLHVARARADQADAARRAGGEPVSTPPRGADAGQDQER